MLLNTRGNAIGVVEDGRIKQVLSLDNFGKVEDGNVVGIHPLDQKCVNIVFMKVIVDNIFDMITESDIQLVYLVFSNFLHSTDSGQQMGHISGKRENIVQLHCFFFHFF